MTKLRIWRVVRPVLVLLFLLSIPRTVPAYSVLTHEAIIDSMWASDIKPLLLKRFPNATPAQLREAHAHAYGGAIIQDMGYYPFGSRLFSDLAHYVRSGEFVETLIRDSQDLNEYAFALGALCHYAADNEGHPKATNLSVPILYPKLRHQYGDTVTYAEDPTAHIQTEFGFDVIQVAEGHYASEAYHDFIGFKVAQPLLERAFKETYGIELKSIFLSLDLALGTYRYSVSSVIPTMTKVAWQANKDEIAKQTPGITRRKYVYRLSHAAYRKEWGNRYQKPGIFARILAVVFTVIPKVGPFKALAIKPSTPETRKLFVESFKATVEYYRQLLGQVQAGDLALENKDFDTGKPTRAGEYALADQAYAGLLDKLATQHFENASPDLRQNILAFYGDAKAPATTDKDAAAWQKTMRELTELRAASGQPVPAKPN